MAHRPGGEPVKMKYMALNDQTQNITRCAWPNCRAMTGYRNKVTGGIDYDRVGVLCWPHGEAVADAVLEQRLRAADFMHHELKHATFDADARKADERARIRARQAEDREQQGEAPGWVYYLLVGDRVKIGYSADVRKRMRSYPPGSELLAVEPGGPQLEVQRHREFAGSLADGREWFRRDAVLLDHIDRTAQMHSDGRRFAHHYRSNQQPMRQVRRR